MIEHVTTVMGGLVIQQFPPVEAPPVSLVPQSISRAQGKAVLIQLGLWDATAAFVAAIPDPVERALAEVALHDTTVWQRNSPFLAAAAEGLGITPEQMDGLFLAASGIAL